MKDFTLSVIYFLLAGGAGALAGVIVAALFSGLVDFIDHFHHRR